MPTITTARAETRTITIAASPAAVLAVVGDGARLPEWAPRFAAAVEHEGDDRWLIGEGDGRFAVRLRVDHTLGTADILRPVDPPTGAFMRVVPNGEGSELLFTLFFPDGTAPEAVDVQMATVEGELATVRTLAEAAG